MITRPVITSTFSIHNSGESALYAILLDDSFSMQGNIDITKKTAENILQMIPNKGQLIWFNINKGLQYKGLKEDMPTLNNFLRFTYHAGNVTEGLNSLKQYIEKEYTSTEIYILTDSQYDSMQDLWKHSNQFNDMHLYTLIAPQLNDNISITNVQLLSEILMPNHPIKLEVSLKNIGQVDQENILLQLIIDNMSVGQQLVSLPTNKTQTFIFKTALSNTGIHRAMVELDTDDRESDNRYFFNLYIPNQINIALISNSQEESYYIQASIKALNKSGESLSISQFYSLDDPALKLENHDAIFIIEPNILRNVGDSKIEEYIYNGGHIILLPSIYSMSEEYSIINTLVSDIGGNYQKLPFSDLLDNSFQEIDLSSIQIEEIYNLFVSATGQDRNIRLFKYLTLPYAPEYSQLILNDGSTVWNRYNIHSGIIDVFGFAMNINWSNFPIKGTFLPFINYLAYSHISANENLYETIGNNWKVIPEAYYSKTIFHVLPNGSRNIINIDENNHLITDILQQPGYHSMQTDKVNISQIAVNIDDSELNCNYATIATLKNKMPEFLQIIPMKNDIIAEIKQARIGIELWKYILYMVIFLLIIEMLISNVRKRN